MKDLNQARTVSRTVSELLAPAHDLPIVTVLDPSEGWAQWDMAVRLLDAQSQPDQRPKP